MRMLSDKKWVIHGYLKRGNEEIKIGRILNEYKQHENNESFKIKQNNSIFSCLQKHILSPLLVVTIVPTLRTFIIEINKINQFLDNRLLHIISYISYISIWFYVV